MLQGNQAVWAQAVADKQQEAVQTDTLAKVISEGGIDKAVAQGKLSETQQKFADDKSAEADALKKSAQQQLQASEQYFNQIKDQKIDPDRAWNNMGTGRQILMVIASGLGGAAQGLLHLGNNQMLDNLKSTIDRDVAAQKDDFEHNSKNAQTMYAQAYHMTNNAQEATKLATQLGMTAAATKAEAIGTQTDNQALAQRASIAAQQIRTESNKIALEGINDYIKNTKYSPATGKTDILQDPRVQKWAADEAQKAAAEGREVNPDQLLKHAAAYYYPGSQRGAFAPIAKPIKPEKPSPEDRAESKEVRADDDYLASLHALKTHMDSGGSLLYGQGASLLADTKMKARSSSVGRPASESLIGESLPSGTSITNINADRVQHAIDEAEAAKTRRSSGGDSPGKTFKPLGT
jgi:hypothetical protein